jgi:hypothetical protein
MYDIKFKITVGKPTDQNIEKPRQQQQQWQCFGDCLDLAMFSLVWKTVFFLVFVRGFNQVKLYFQ